MLKKLIPNITLQKLVKGNKEKSKENYIRLIFYHSSVSTERMQFSEPENSQESEQLQSSTAESEIEEDDIRQKYKKVKYVQQASVCKPHTITRSQARNLHDIDKRSILPEQFHIRKSEKRVRDEVYWTMAELSGHGFCYREMQIAIKVVGNTLFGTKWKLIRKLDKDCYDIDGNEMEDESEFDADRLPIHNDMWKMLKVLEAYSLREVGERVLDAKSGVALLTHSTDSTTSKVVETFAPVGIHVNRNEYLPLPILPITSETRNNTADSIATDFSLLEAASETPAEQIYSKIDVHITDSTSHNKEIAENLVETFHKKEIAGQIVCNRHTILGFDKGIAKAICMTENKMGMQNIFSGFSLDIDIDQRKDSVSISTISWCLILFGPENINKPWNYYKDFCKFLQRKDHRVDLFLLKDA